MDYNLEEGTVTLKNGDETKTYSLKSEEDLTNLMKQAQIGWNFKKNQEPELGQLRKTIQSWDNLIDAARNGAEGVDALLERLEGAVGKKLPRQVSEPKKEEPILLDPEENDKLANLINSLKTEIDSLKKEQSIFKKGYQKTQEEEAVAALEKEASGLAKKYDGKSGPAFDKDAVYEFCSKNGITDLELGFKMLNYEDLTKHAQESALKEHKEMLAKRKNARTLGEELSVDLEPTKQKSRSYQDAGLQGLASLKQKDPGFSLFKADVE